MNKEQVKKQYSINAYVEDYFDTYVSEENYHYFPCKQLRSCSAWVYETDNFYLLRSYNTIIASISKQTGEFVDFLRYVYGYTSTSAQHIAKFRNDYRKYIKAYTIYYEIPWKRQKEFDKEIEEMLFK